MFCFHVLSQSSFMFCLFNMFLFDYFSVFALFLFFFIKKMKNQKNTKTVYVLYIGTCVPWMAIETKSSKLCIVCSLDEHLYAQLSK